MDVNINLIDFANFFSIFQATPVVNTYLFVSIFVLEFQLIGSF